MKALVVGGNSGIGLAITKKLLNSDVDFVYIIGKELPPEDVLNNNKVLFKQHNFVNFDINILNDFSDINILVITVGFGRVALFQELTDAEIRNLIRVDLESISRIIKFYYDKINSDIDFYTSVMVSICGQIVSPFFSVYGAAKGGLRFLIENLNCELSEQGCTNRILDVSPGVIDGTSFNGGMTQVDLLDDLSDNIIKRMFDRDTLFIPKYDEVYSNVLARYNNNKEEFGKSSYNYKLGSGRKSTKPQVTIGYLSGTFDLFHIGHLNLLKRAKEQCDYLIVSVHNNGDWKGKETFIPYEERRAIVESIKYVDKVVEDYKEDCDAWDIYHYDKLFVGSDYKGTERFNRYEELLKGKAEIVYFPYTKGTSSTQLRKAIKDGETL